MRRRSVTVLLSLSVVVLLAVMAIPPLIVFSATDESLIVDALPDGDHFTIPIGPVVSRIARFRIARWSKCPASISGTNVLGMTIGAFDGASDNRKKVIREIVVQLIDIGCDLDAYSNGYTPLMTAVVLADKDLVALLLSLGANPLLRVKPADAGSTDIHPPRTSVGMTVPELARSMRLTGVDRHDDRGAIVGLVAGDARQ